MVIKNISNVCVLLKKFHDYIFEIVNMKSAFSVGLNNQHTNFGPNYQLREGYIPT